MANNITVCKEEKNAILRVGDGVIFDDVIVGIVKVDGIPAPLLVELLDAFDVVSANGVAAGLLEDDPVERVADAVVFDGCAGGFDADRCRLGSDAAAGPLDMKPRTGPPRLFRPHPLPGQRRSPAIPHQRG